MPARRTIYSVGHSNHVVAAFLGLLQQHGIEVVIDVRSQPYSQWNPQFNRENLAANLQATGIGYVFMGDSLGGRPEQADLYDPGSERPNYDRQAQTARYQKGIAQLCRIAEDAKMAMMCSEGDPATCHRKLLITETLLRMGERVEHILPDGSLRQGEPEARQLGFNFEGLRQSKPMPTIHTIGFTKKSLEEFATLLCDAGVDVVVDTRLRPNSQLAGYACLASSAANIAPTTATGAW